MVQVYLALDLHVSSIQFETIFSFPQLLSPNFDSLGQCSLGGVK